MNDPFDCFVHIMTPYATDYRKIRDIWHDKLGMICFSRSYTNPVQWSHYADHHRGMVLGFDVDDDLLEEIEYISEPWTVYFTDEKGTDEEWSEVNYAMTCKYIDWKYEEESRIFFQLKYLKKSAGMYFKEFDKKIILKEVILGVKSEISNNRILDSVAGLKGVQIRRATMSEDVYSIRKAIFIEDI
ncbi:DUF2971 domain-containing protein [Saccharophagus degradans]|uniref:DUF2971 domain-containing protein n=1 Tax=Saccharophagus degradans TaxID=86304 RepID=UPI001C0997D0|nr:DUF2971 domain-containing protein [Saccharophagus degradans]MBU2987399.1 DUF2971 domain-containing protein [Saccharophagus degradans]